MATSLLTSISRAVDEFISGRYDLEALQEQLSDNAGALDNTYGELRSELEAVDADLEVILYTVPPNEQRAAAVARLERIRELVAWALSRANDSWD